MKPVAECAVCGESIWHNDDAYMYDDELYCCESCLKERIAYDLNHHHLDPFRSRYYYEQFIKDMRVRVQ